jgi:hypothetical protein
MSEAIASPEPYLDLKTGCRLIPGRDGKATHVSTMVRWITRGCRLSNGSRVRLRAIGLPGGWRTTRQWLDEFVGALTTDRLGERDERDGRAVLPRAHRTAAQRRDAAQKAAVELAALGCKPGHNPPIGRRCPWGRIGGIDVLTYIYPAGAFLGTAAVSIDPEAIVASEAVLEG